MSNQSVLFYSERCAHSKSLIQELYKAGLIDAFQKLNVDQMRSIPSGIKSVPTMIVPRYPRPLVGKECFMWVQGIKQQQSMAQTQNNPNAQEGRILSGTSGAPMGESGGVNVSNAEAGGTNAMAGSDGVPGFQDLLPYSQTMGGFSDGFSFLQDSSPMEHQFAFISPGGMAPNSMGGGIQTPQEITSSSKQDSLDMALSNLKASRDRDMHM